jgi:hypothetical protein
MCASRVTWHTSIRYSSSCHIPLPRDLADLKARIVAAVNNIGAPMLTRVWQELKYRIEVCRFPRGVKKTCSVFLLLSFGLPVINVCNHGEHYEMSCICATVISIESTAV